MVWRRPQVEFEEAGSAARGWNRPSLLVLQAGLPGRRERENILAANTPTDRP